MTITIEPPFDLVGISQYGKNQAERAVLRIASPMRAGKTLIKRGEGDWYCKRTPSQMELDAAVMFFLGGHVYEIDEATLADILANVGDACLPSVTADSLYPADDLYPSDGLIPRS